MTELKEFRLPWLDKVSEKSFAIEFKLHSNLKNQPNALQNILKNYTFHELLNCSDGFSKSMKDMINSYLAIKQLDIDPSAPLEDVLHHNLVGDHKLQSGKRCSFVELLCSALESLPIKLVSVEVAPTVTVGTKKFDNVDNFEINDRFGDEVESLLWIFYENSEMIFEAGMHEYFPHFEDSFSGFAIINPHVSTEDFIENQSSTVVAVPFSTESEDFDEIVNALDLEPTSTDLSISSDADVDIFVNELSESKDLLSGDAVNNVLESHHQIYEDKFIEEFELPTHIVTEDVSLELPNEEPILRSDDFFNVVDIISPTLSESMGTDEYDATISAILTQKVPEDLEYIFEDFDLKVVDLHVSDDQSVEIDEKLQIKFIKDEADLGVHDEPSEYDSSLELLNNSDEFYSAEREHQMDEKLHNRDIGNKILLHEITGSPHSEIDAEGESQTRLR